MTSTVSYSTAADKANRDWSKTAPTYADNVGRTSAMSASRLVELAHGLSRITGDSTALDVGAGAGAVTFAIASSFPWTQILAADVSSTMLEDIAASQLPTVTTQVLDARSLTKKLQKESFTHVFSTFMLQTIRTPLFALQEMHAILAPGGVVGIGLWGQRNGPFEIWEEAARSVVPGYTLPTPFDDPNAWRTREELENALKEVGFEDVSSEEVKMPFEFDTAKSFVEFWFQAKNPASERCMSNYEGSIEYAGEAVERLVREQYQNGKDICTWAVLGVGKKQG